MEGPGGADKMEGGTGEICPVESHLYLTLMEK